MGLTKTITCHDIRACLPKFMEEKQCKRKALRSGFPADIPDLYARMPGFTNFFPSPGRQEYTDLGADVHYFGLHFHDPKDFRSTLRKVWRDVPALVTHGFICCRVDLWPDVEPSLFVSADGRCRVSLSGPSAERALKAQQGHGRKGTGVLAKDEGCTLRAEAIL